jgi:hypothetical protein
VITKRQERGLIFVSVVVFVLLVSCCSIVLL